MHEQPIRWITIANVKTKKKQHSTTTNLVCLNLLTSLVILVYFFKFFFLFSYCCCCFHSFVKPFASLTSYKQRRNKNRRKHLQLYLITIRKVCCLKSHQSNDILFFPLIFLLIYYYHYFLQLEPIFITFNINGMRCMWLTSEILSLYIDIQIV